MNKTLATVHGNLKQVIAQITATVDKDLESPLLASALTRLDELPIRLVEADSHGSPWHEFASSNIVQQAVRIVPGFAPHKLTS